jgi:hypothetical protein
MREGEIMKRPLVFLCCLALLMFACTISTTATPPTVTVVQPVTVPAVTEPPPATEPPAATEPPTATEPSVPTETPAPLTNVSCNELLLYVDAALASGYDCQTIPEVSGQGFDVNPQYTELTLQGYPLSDRFFTPRIEVYPVLRFSELAPEAVNPRLVSLHALIGGGPVGDSLPLLPIFNAAQIFHAQYRVIGFSGGAGIRFLTEYAQYTAPINNHDMFYTFQGLTGNGLYWISAIFPISNAVLPENGDNPPNGQSFEDFSNNYQDYLAEIVPQLNSQTADSFTPSLTALDTLVASILIQP